MRGLRAQLDLIEAGDAEIGALEAAAGEAGQVYRARAEALHANRVAAALRLDAAVAGELAPLKLDAARFRTTVTELPEERWGAHGLDAVEFLIATNPGAGLRAARQDRQRRRAVALHPRAEGGARRAGRRGDGDLRRDRPRRRRRGGQRDRRAAGAGWRREGQLLAVTHSPQVRGARRDALPDRGSRARAR